MARSSVPVVACGCWWAKFEEQETLGVGGDVMGRTISSRRSWSSPIGVELEGVGMEGLGVEGAAPCVAGPPPGQSSHTRSPTL